MCVSRCVCEHLCVRVCVCVFGVKGYTGVRPVSDHKQFAGNVIATMSLWCNLGTNSSISQ